MDIRLFPTDLREREWVEFEADGYSVPVPGVVYRDGSVERGVPLGALGTGCIVLGTDGTLDYFSTIFNAFLERTHLAGQAPEDSTQTRDYNWMQGARSNVPDMKLPFLGLAVGNRAWVLTLQDVEGVENASQVHYWGHYPVADLEYETSAPVSVGLRAWSPFYPGDAAGSNTPGAVFQVHLRNTSQEAQQGTVALSFHGPRHEELAFNLHGPLQLIAQKAEFQRRGVSGDFEGVAVETRWEDMPYGYALGAVGADSVRVGGELAGGAWKDIRTTLPDTMATDPGASAAVDFALDAGESTTVTFVLGWHAPLWRARARGTNIRYGLNEYIHMYATRFESALEVANHLAVQHASLLDRVLAWQQVVYGEEGLPGWLRDSLVNIFAVLAQQSFWAKSPDPGHWWGDEGLFFVNESLLSCPQQCCIANDSGAEWTVDIFFPDLARNKLRAFKHYQRPSGQTPSTLGTGTEPDQPWSDQQLPFDGQVYIHLVQRLWQVTGDRGVLEEFYDSVKAGARFMRTVDKDGDGIPDVKGSNQFYDNWPEMEGAAVHVATYWLATLRMVESMALEMDDGAFVEECRGWFRQAGESIERVLWNEKAGSYLLYHHPETGVKSDSILSNQLNGQGYAGVYGLPRILPGERVRRVMETVWRLNVGSTRHGVRVAVRPDGGADATSTGTYSSCMIPADPSITPAMVLIYGGDRERGEELMRRAWRRMVIDLQRPWDMPCGLDADGNHLFGLEYYQNTMLWALPIALLGQDIKTFSAPRGLRERIVGAGRALR